MDGLCDERDGGYSAHTNLYLPLRDADFFEGRTRVDAACTPEGCLDPLANPDQRGREVQQVDRLAARRAAVAVRAPPVPEPAQT